MTVFFTVLLSHYTEGRLVILLSSINVECQTSCHNFKSLIVVAAAPQTNARRL